MADRAELEHRLQTAMQAEVAAHRAEQQAADGIVQVERARMLDLERDLAEVRDQLAAARRDQADTAEQLEVARHLLVTVVPGRLERVRSHLRVVAAAVAGARTSLEAQLGASAAMRSAQEQLAGTELIVRTGSCPCCRPEPAPSGHRIATFQLIQGDRK